MLGSQPAAAFGLFEGGVEFCPLPSRPQMNEELDIEYVDPGNRILQVTLQQIFGWLTVGLAALSSADRFLGNLSAGVFRAVRDDVPVGFGILCPPTPVIELDGHRQQLDGIMLVQRFIGTRGETAEIRWRQPHRKRRTGGLLPVAGTGCRR
jgi:hypothetical protein